MGRALGTTAVILDGVVMAAGADGRPDAERLQRRLDGASDSAIRRMARSAPVVYMVFDLLWHEGHPTVDLPYDERRQRLDALGLHGPAWQTPASHPGQGRALLEASATQGLRGVVAKRLTSPYHPGTTSKEWIEVVTG